MTSDPHWEPTAPIPPVHDTIEPQTPPSRPITVAESIAHALIAENAVETARDHIVEAGTFGEQRGAVRALDVLVAMCRETGAGRVDPDTFRHALRLEAILTDTDPYPQADGYTTGPNTPPPVHLNRGDMVGYCGQISPITSRLELATCATCLTAPELRRHLQELQIDYSRYSQRPSELDLRMWAVEQAVALGNTSAYLAVDDATKLVAYIKENPNAHT